MSGKRTKGQRLSADAKREALAVVEELLAHGRYTWEVKDAFRKNWGRFGEHLPLSARAVMRLVREVKARIREAVGAPESELLAESYNTYLYLLRKPEATTREKILARTALDNLLGLPKPRRLAVDVRNERTAAEAERLATLRQKIVADPEASRLSCELIERLADAEAEKRNGGRQPCGLRELDRPSTSDGNGEANRE
jgi:hypothetical protein